MYGKTIFILSLSAINLFALVLSKEEVSSSGYFIQVASLKKSINIKKVKKRLYNFNLYIEPYQGLKRIYIVNIEKKSKFLEIKKLYPDAFITKRPQTLHSGEKEKILDKSPPILDLNSNTILKTRKSFL